MQPASDLETYRGYSEGDLALFEKFADSAVLPLPGYVTTFHGARFPINVLPKELGVLNGQKLGVPIPCDFLSDVIEWVGLLRSVSEARGTFRMMELGAGFGPWSAYGGVAAEKYKLKAEIVSVEADPERFAALRETMSINRIHATLHEAAVGVASGIGHWPRVENSLMDAGLRLLADDTLTDRGLTYAAKQEIKIIGFSELIGEADWDLIHIDIQGHELDICAAALDALSKHVRRLVIGIHSRKLDGDIFDLFCRAGWHLENEKPTRFVFRQGLSPERMTTHDGTQVWANPSLNSHEN